MYVYEYNGKLYANFDTPKALLLQYIEDFIKKSPEDDYFAKRLPPDINNRMINAIVGWNEENGTMKNEAMQWEAWGNFITRKTVFQ